MKLVLTLAGLSLMAAPVAAETLDVSFELPRISVAEYHKPYVALWIAREDHTVAANLAVLYQHHDGPEGEGETWLKDMRQWWRRTGRSLDLPIDGVSSATRGPGQHAFSFDADSEQLRDLPAGRYVLNIEASREVGGREHLRIPFEWGDGNFEGTAEGSSELSTISLSIQD